MHSSGWDCEIDIQKTIQLVRSQRSGMVQTEVKGTVVWVYTCAVVIDFSYSNNTNLCT